MKFTKTTTYLLLLLSLLGTFWSLFAGNMEAVIGWVVSFVIVLNISESEAVLSWSYFDEEAKTVTLQFSNKSEVIDFARTHQRYVFPVKQPDFSGTVQATYLEKRSISLSDRSSMNSKSSEEIN